MTFNVIVFAICVFLTSSENGVVFAQNNVTTDASMPAVTRPVNLFIINDESNKVANLSVMAAVKMIKEKYPDQLGKVHVVQINSSDADNTLDRICAAWTSAIQEGGSTVPDLVLDTTMAGEGADVVSSFSLSLGLPTLSGQFGQEGDLRYWRALDAEKQGFLIQVMPPADLLPEAIRQLAIELNVPNAAIMYDDEFVMNHKYKSLLLNVPTRHIIIHSPQSVGEMRPELSRLRDLDVVNFFVLGDENTVTVALEAAESLNFTGRKYGWFVLTLNDDFWPRCECRNITVLFMKPNIKRDQANSDSGKPVLSEPLISSGFYYDLTRLSVLAMKSAIEAGEWPSEPKHIDCETYNGPETTPDRKLDLLKKLKTVTRGYPASYASIKWGDKNGQHQAEFTASIHLTYIENAVVSSTVESGSWKAGIESPLQVTNEEIKNTTAVTSYRIVTVAQPPFMMYNKDTDKWYGFCIDLLEEVRKAFDFEYDIHEVEDGQYGTLSENGTWNGMIKELIDKRADIALGTLWVMAEREKVVDFTVPYYDLVGLTLMMVKPKTSTSLFKFLTVLENEVWFCILGAFCFTSILMWIFDRLSPYSYQNNREKYKNDEEKRVFNLRECLWFCMTSLTPQGGGEAPKNLSGRLVAATWWLFGFIIIASYTANLAAFLTVSRLDTPVESLDDLSKQYKIQYAPVKDSPAYIYFQRMADIETRFYEIWKDMSLNDSLSDVDRAKLAVWDYPVSDKYTKMFQAMKEAGFPNSTEAAIRRVRRLDSNNEFAFIADASTIKYLVMMNCDLTQVGDEFSRKPYALAVQQGSPLKDKLNNAILDLLNKRKLEKLKDKWWRRNTRKKDCENENDESDGISIYNIGGVFVVIVIGIVFSLSTLAFEYWWFRYRPRMKELKKAKEAEMHSTKPVKPIRFNLRPAPTHAIQASGFRSRF